MITKVQDKRTVWATAAVATTVTSTSTKNYYRFMIPRKKNRILKIGYEK